MLKHERFQYLLKKIEKDQKISAKDLSLEMNVSEATLRRDITELSEQGKVHKIHGGAILPSPMYFSFQERKELHGEAKMVMAKKALSLIKPGAVIAIDVGTTNLELARCLPLDLQVTIITNSPTIAQQFSQHPKVEVILSGGTYYKYGDSVIGAEACQTFERYYVDLCFLGICSIHSEFGVSNAHYEETLVKNAMVRSAGEVVAMVNAEKLERRDHFKVCDIGDIATLITNLPPDDHQLVNFQKKEIHIL